MPPAIPAASSFLDTQRLSCAVTSSPIRFSIAPVDVQREYSAEIVKGRPIASTDVTSRDIPGSAASARVTTESTIS